MEDIKEVNMKPNKMVYFLDAFTVGDRVYVVFHLEECEKFNYIEEMRFNGETYELEPRIKMVRAGEYGGEYMNNATLETFVIQRNSFLPLIS